MPDVDLVVLDDDDWFARITSLELREMQLHQRMRQIAINNAKTYPRRQKTKPQPRPASPRSRERSDLIWRAVIGERDNFTFIECCTFRVIEQIGNILSNYVDMFNELRDIAHDAVKQLLMWSYVCAVLTWRAVCSLLWFFIYVPFRGAIWLFYIFSWAVLWLGIFPIYLMFFCGKEWLQHLIFRPELTDEQLHELLDMIRMGPPRRTYAQVKQLINEASTLAGEAPRWALRGKARVCTKAEMVRLRAILEAQKCSWDVFFGPQKRASKRSDVVHAPPRSPSPPSNSGMSYPNARSGSPQRLYPYQTETTPRKNQWMGTTSYKRSKKGQRSMPDQSNRTERIQAAQERRKACLAAKAKKKMADDSRREEMARKLEIGRAINREDGTSHNKGKRAVVPSSLKTVPEGRPIVRTLKDWSPLSEVDVSKDDDTQSVKTEDVPLPQTFHGEEQRIKRSIPNYRVQRTLKHGPVAPGHRKDTYVHRPTVEGDPVVVTAKSGDDFVIVTNI